MERIVIINFGAQYNQLIARRVREAGVYSELLPPDSPIEKIKGDGLCGIILSGGPDSAYLEGSRTFDAVNGGMIAMGDKLNFVVPTGNFGDILGIHHIRKA